MDINEFITSVIPVKDRRLREYLKKVCRIDVFKQGDHINEIGEKDVFVRFLIKGVVRGYIINPRGKEVTTSLGMFPGDIIAGSRMMDGSYSEVGFTVIKDSEVFSIPIEEIMNLRTRYQEIADLYVYVLAKCIAYHWNIRKMLCLDTARERYEWFLKEYPGLIDCMNHAQIASFLNITPVTLSRIRHNIKNQ